MGSKTQVVKKLLNPLDEASELKRLATEAKLHDMRMQRVEGMDAQINEMMEEYVATGGPQVSHDQWVKQMQNDPDGTAAALAAQRQHVPRIESSRHVKVSAADAEARLANGDHPATVFQQTGWYRVPDGPKDRRMRFFLSDADTRIDSAALRKRADVANIKEGEVRPITFRVEEVLDHPDLFEVYPELRNTQVTFHVKNSGQEGYRVYDPDYSFTRGELDSVRDHITVFNDAHGDLGRKTILHEINHVVQKLEGWSGGASPKMWEELMEETETLLHHKRMTDDILNGRVDLDDMSDMMRYSDEYMKKYNASQEMVDKLLTDLTQVVELDLYAEMLEPVLDKGLRDTALFLKQIGANEDVEGMLRATTPQMRRNLARSRYLRQLGEAESRIRENLSDVTREQMREMRMTPIETLEEAEGLKPEDLIP